MIQFKQLPDYYFVQIEGDAKNFKIKDDLLLYSIKANRPGYTIKKSIIIEGKYSLIGTYQWPDRFDFDVDKLNIEEVTKWDCGWYKDYIKENGLCKNFQESFLSLLASNGVKFENEMEEVDIHNAGSCSDLIISYNEWKQLQSEIETNRKSTFVILKKEKQ